MTTKILLGISALVAAVLPALGGLPESEIHGVPDVGDGVPLS